ncbi:hypothetical protein F2Q69_00028999 [Brassica cretica]|uniref:Uncharacterized protein n=1 Tax=Brassica cretica TaxID=69181 RepID=A0A8S9SAN3_BRACR|nr:hypothetical protein F2Q69_00028999 [Brassica cretica]
MSYSESAYERYNKVIALAARASGEFPSSNNLRLRKPIPTITPIETKQETVRPRPKGGSSGDENACFWIDPTLKRRNWTRLIQLAVGRVGDGLSNSPLGELAFG